MKMFGARRLPHDPGRSALRTIAVSLARHALGETSFAVFPQTPFLELLPLHGKSGGPADE